MDYKFEKGDRVRAEGRDKTNTYTGTITNIEGNKIYVSKDDGSSISWQCLVNSDGRVCTASGLWDGHSYLQKITEPQYTAITPKVGERYRVLKPMKGFFFFSHDASEVIGQEIVFKGSNWSKVNCNGQQYLDSEFQTTEYLELVEEPYNPAPLLAKVQTAMYGGYIYQSDGAVIRQISVDLRGISIEPEQINKDKKLTFMQKLTSALKRALSPEKQTLYKVGHINGGLDLSSGGREAYINALFQNNGDHAKAVAEMVAAAEEELAEDQD